MGVVLRDRGDIIFTNVSVNNKNAWLLLDTMVGINTNRSVSASTTNLKSKNNYKK